MTHTFSELKIIIGTRRSQLAMWQTNHIAALLQKRWSGLKCEIRPIDTRGDRNLDTPLPEIGGKGLFTAELEACLRDKTIDLAVHSLKDLPVEDVPGLKLGLITSREDVHDVLVSRENLTLAALPAGAIVGTSSPRRRLQLLAARPDLDVRPIRGNVNSRIRKVFDGEFDAAVLASAGLTRLELTDVISEHLPLDIMLPAPGQGALAVQCRDDDPFIDQLLEKIDDPACRDATVAERTFMAALGGGCSAPIAAYGRYTAIRELQLEGLVASPDGQQIIRVSGSGSDPTALGLQLAGEARKQGASDLIGK